jgi:CHASE3 domain sensor protein
MGRSPLRAKGNVVVAIPLVALVVAAVLFGVAMAQDREAQGRVLHTVEVEHQVAQVRALALEAETGARGYLLTGQDHYLEPYELARRVRRARWPVWGA